MVNFFKVGDEINLFSEQYSSFYPELLPIEVSEDPLIDGKPSIYYFIQTERIPEDCTTYKCTIDGIEISNKKEDDRTIIYIFLKDLEKVFSINRRKNSIINLKEEKAHSRDFFNDNFVWDANSGQVRLSITKEIETKNKKGAMNDRPEKT